MTSERSGSHHLKLAVTALSERLFRVASGNPAVFYLVDITSGCCTCSNEGMEGECTIHVEKVRQYVKLKKKEVFEKVCE